MSQIDYESILNLRTQGGENSFYPNVYGEFVQSNTADYIGVVEFNLSNIDFPFKDYIQPNCVDGSCIKRQGIWTTAIVTEEEITLNGFTYYWVTGPVDKDGGVWITDVGFFGIRDLSINIVETNQPISSDAKYISRTPIPAGIKFAFIKRVTRFRVENIHNIIGTRDSLIRSSKGNLLTYTYEDQKLSLRDLSLGLLSLLDETYVDNNPCLQIIGRPDSDAKISALLKSTNSKIYKLLEPTPTERQNSVIHNLTTYIKPSDIFGFDAENLYKNPVIIPVDRRCLGEDCIADKEIRTLINREVNNESIAWLIIYSTEYIRITQDRTIEASLLKLMSYLVTQMDIRGFVYKGWQDSAPISQSTKILSTSIEVNVVSFIAFLKAFELTQEDIYLDKAMQVKDYVMNNFYIQKTKLFKGESAYPNIKSLTYGLLFSEVSERKDISQSILSYLSSRTANTGAISQEEVIDDGEEVLNQSETVWNFNLSETNSIFHYFPDENYSFLESEILNSILINLIRDSSVNIPFVITNRIDFLLNSKSVSLFKLSLSLKSTSALSRIKSNQIRYINSLEFSRSRLYSIAKFFYPSNYSWGSEQGQSSNGSLGKLIQSLVRPAALLYSFTLRRLNSNLLSRAEGFDLDSLSRNEYLSPRRYRESDSQLRERIRINISRQLDKSNKPALVARLARLSLISNIFEKYRRTTTFNDTYRNLSPVNESYLSGALETTAVVDVTIFENITKVIEEEVKVCTPAGVQTRIIQSIQMSPCSIPSQLKEDYFFVTLATSTDGFILSEDGINYVLDEEGCPIKLEDALPPVFPNPDPNPDPPPPNPDPPPTA